MQQNSKFKNEPRPLNGQVTSRHLSDLDKLLARAKAIPAPKQVERAEGEETIEERRIKKLEAKLRRIEERRRIREAKLAAKQKRLEQREKYSGGIDPTTGFPFRGNGVATAGVMTRNAAALAIRFRKLGDNETADRLAAMAEYGRSITDWLAQAAKENLAKVSMQGTSDRK